MGNAEEPPSFSFSRNSSCAPEFLIFSFFHGARWFIVLVHWNECYGNVELFSELFLLPSTTIRPFKIRPILHSTFYEITPPSFIESQFLVFQKYRHFKKIKPKNSKWCRISRNFENFRNSFGVQVFLIYISSSFIKIGKPDIPHVYWSNANI